MLGNQVLISFYAGVGVLPIYGLVLLSMKPVWRRNSALCKLAQVCAMLFNFMAFAKRKIVLGPSDKGLEADLFLDRMRKPPRCQPEVQGH